MYKTSFIQVQPVILSRAPPKLSNLAVIVYPQRRDPHNDLTKFHLTTLAGSYTCRDSQFLWEKVDVSRMICCKVYACTVYCVCTLAILRQSSNY